LASATTGGYLVILASSRLTEKQDEQALGIILARL
jgi:hypothetical protein